MTLFLDGHGYKYDVEQSLLAYFPDAKPRYTGDGRDADAVSVLRVGPKTAESTALLKIDGRTARASARTRHDAADARGRDRLLRHCVKLSFYRAAKELTG
ncbi:MAG: coproporphyrinogen dehydrogenase HemZ, partial [Oscillospiraceae bacterium]|nr:coproporphyrinogen dehydrogenase HemZ [Oscillospiraceae bacterium]